MFDYVAVALDHLIVVFNHLLIFVGRGGTLVESMPFDRKFESHSSRHARALKIAYHPWNLGGEVLYLQLPVALRRVNSDTMSIAVVGSASD